MNMQEVNKTPDAPVASANRQVSSKSGEAAAGNGSALLAHSKSAEVFRHNRRFIPGGVVSVSRAVQPEIVFTKGEGAYIGTSTEIDTSTVTQRSLHTFWGITIPASRKQSFPYCAKTPVSTAQAQPNSRGNSRNSYAVMYPQQNQS